MLKPARRAGACGRPGRVNLGCGPPASLLVGAPPCFLGGRPQGVRTAAGVSVGALRVRPSVWGQRPPRRSGSSSPLAPEPSVSVLSSRGRGSRPRALPRCSGWSRCRLRARGLRTGVVGARGLGLLSFGVFSCFLFVVHSVKTVQDCLQKLGLYCRGFGQKTRLSVAGSSSPGVCGRGRSRRVPAVGRPLGSTWSCCLRGAPESGSVLGRPRHQGSDRAAWPLRHGEGSSQHAAVSRPSLYCDPSWLGRYSRPQAAGGVSLPCGGALAVGVRRG